MKPSNKKASLKFYFGFLVLVGFSFIAVQIYFTPLIYTSTTVEIKDFFKVSENNKNNGDDDGYDFVTLIHHDDMHIFIDYGLDSWMKYFSYSPNSRVYAICSPKACEHLQLNIIKSKYDNLILVNENVFPFTLDDVKYNNAKKPTWIYQQVLKLHSYQILSNSTIVNPPIKPLFLLIDSDTIALRTFQFIRRQNGINIPIYNIASEQTGAFHNDCALQSNLINDLFPKQSITPAFRNTEKMQYTSITHMMMFDGEILNEILVHLSQTHDDIPAWQVLANMNAVLSEWEVYMAWIMNRHDEKLFLKQIPYVNWGNITVSNLEWLKETQDVYYVTKHDDWNEYNICCVNSKWSKLKYKEVRWTCNCCGNEKDCGDVTINCKVLKIPGCQYDKDDGLMSFSSSMKSKRKRRHWQKIKIIL